MSLDTTPEGTSDSLVDSAEELPTPQPKDNDSTNLFTEETIDNLSSGFLEILQPEVTRVQQSLKELISNQEEMLGSIQDKRVQFEDSTKLQEIQSLLELVPAYKQKLLVASRNMATLDKRVKRIQMRADKLKELRIMKENQMKMEFEQKIKEEEMLEAKPSK